MASVHWQDLTKQVGENVCFFHKIRRGDNIVLSVGVSRSKFLSKMVSFSIIIRCIAQALDLQSGFNDYLLPGIWRYVFFGSLHTPDEPYVRR